MPPDADSEGLQFDRAEPVHDIAESAPPPRVLENPGAADLLRAAAYGIGAGVLGAALYFGVLVATGYEIGWVSLIVGWLVGKAVSRGGRGLGGPKLQALAVALTYLSIIASYWPLRFALVPPFIQGRGGILGIIILAIGLYEAWRLNRRL